MTFHLYGNNLSAPRSFEDALEHIRTCHEHHSPLDRNIEYIETALHQNISSFSQEKSTVCMNQAPPSTQEMKDFLKNWQPEAGVISEESSPSLLSNLIQETSPNPDVSQVLENEDPRMIHLLSRLTQNSPSIQTQCTTVLCISKEIFGERQGLQLLYMLAKYGFNGSPYPFQRRTSGDLWESDDLDKVLTALSDFPEGRLPFVRNKPLIRFKKGYTRSEYADRGPFNCVLANSYIEVFDCLIEKSAEKFSRTMIHEVGHIIGAEADLDSSPTWLNISGWEETRTRKNGRIVVSYTINKPECIVSQYGRTSPVEDFAESVEAYRYNPELLKKCPSKYYYIKDFVFQGKEYTDIC